MSCDFFHVSNHMKVLVDEPFLMPSCKLQFCFGQLAQPINEPCSKSAARLRNPQAMERNRNHGRILARPCCWAAGAAIFFGTNEPWPDEALE